MATVETSSERDRAQNIRVKCSPPMRRHTAISLGHWPGGGRRRNGRRISNKSAKRKIMKRKGEKCCMPKEPAMKLPAQTVQMIRISARSRAGIL